MKRRELLKDAGTLAAGAALGALATKLPREALAMERNGEEKAVRMPVAFTGHGNPMNAVRTTTFTKFLRAWKTKFPRPTAILSVSAHWEGPALAVTSGAKPDTIHDFYGFPQNLYDVRYPAPGAPVVAERVRALLAKAGLTASDDPTRGLDHGCWMPLVHVYPGADVPIVQLSLLHDAPGEWHLRVGRALAPLRDEGVLILGSGNLVHNLGTVDFEHIDAPPPSWSTQFDAWVKDTLDRWNLPSLSNYLAEAPRAQFCHPTAEHYVPLLVAVGAAEGDAKKKPSVTHVFEGFEHSTISMRCVQFA